MAKITLILPTISGGSGGNTNLSYTASPTQGTVNSDTGTDAVLPLADLTNAGLLSPIEKAEIASALQPGDVTQYTDELAQDAIGTILLDTATIDLSYNDGTPSISADVRPNSITATELSNSINVSEFVNDSGYSTTTYVDGKIIDSIADADTTHAPSRNAVFDALSSKEDSVNKVTTMTGNTTSNIVFLTAKAVYDWGVGKFQENISAGAFAGVFDVSGGKNLFYNDYITGSALYLSLSVTRIYGSISTVRIKGGLVAYIPLTWNFTGDLISVDSTKLNEISILYISDSDIRVVNRVLNLDNSITWLLSGYSEALFTVQSPAGSIFQLNNKIYPAVYGSVGYGNKGLSVKYLPSGVSGGIVFKKITASDSDVVIGFHDSNVITSFSSIKVAMFLSSVDGRISRFESGTVIYNEVAIVGYYFRIYRTGSVFTLQKSSDGTSWTTISTYTYTNSGNMYLVVDVNDNSANMPNEMYYAQTIGLV